MATPEPRNTQLPRGAEHRPSSLTPDQKHAAAAERRRRPSDAERRLWGEICDGAIDGFRFSREKEILGWWADFYCAAGRLVVEVDGKEHRDRRAEDNRRDEVMRANHYRVLRLPAGLIFNDLPEAVERIRLALDNDWARRRRARFADRARSPVLERTVEVEDTVPSVLVRQKPQPAKRKFHCRRCERSFVVDVNSSGWIECRGCMSPDQLGPVCRGCDKPVSKVVSRSWFCADCELIRNAASQAAGSGETPTGPLHQRRGRARRIGR